MLFFTVYIYVLVVVRSTRPGAWNGVLRDREPIRLSDMILLVTSVLLLLLVTLVSILRASEEI